MLSDDDFTYDGSTYTITELRTRSRDGGHLRLRFAPALSDEHIAALTLEFGSHELALSEANNFQKKRFDWTSTGVTWRNRENVSLSLTETICTQCLVSQTVSGTSVVLTFGGDMDTTSVPPISAFTVTTIPYGSETVETRGITAVAIDGATVTLTLDSAVTSGRPVALSYTKPATGSKLQDESGNEVDSISDTQVENETPVRVTSAEVSGRRLTITFDTPLNRTNNNGLGIPPNSAFTVKKTPSGSTTEETVALASGSPAVIELWTAALTLGTAIVLGDTVTVSYTKPESGGRLQDSDAGDIESFEDQSVTNNSKAPVVSEAEALRTEVVLIFDTEMDPNSRPPHSSFAVKKTPTGSTTEETVALTSNSAARIVGKSVMLRLDAAILPAKTVKVSYTKPATGAKLQDLLGNEVKSFNDNNADLVVPVLSTASVEHTSLVLTFDRTLAAAANLANSAFTVKKAATGGGTTTLTLDSGTPPTMASDTVTLTLASTSAISWTDTGVTVSYTKPTTGSNNLLAGDTSGEVATFTDEAVVNERYAAPTSDCPAPTLTGRRVIWAATVTVVRDYFNVNNNRYGYMDLEPSDIQDFGSISRMNLTIGTKTYRVEAARVPVGGGTFTFGLTNGVFPGGVRERLWMHVCNTTLKFIDADIDHGSAEKYEFRNAGFNWTNVTSRTLHLSVPTTAAPTALVSNFGQFTRSELDRPHPHGMGFSTGSNAGGYVLNSIAVLTRDRDNTPFSATVCQAESNGFPTAAPGQFPSHGTCLPLTSPTAFSPGMVTFTAPSGSILAPNTDYVVAFVASSGNVYWTLTESDSVDTSSAPGWSYSSRHFYWNSRWVWSSPKLSQFVAVRGDTESPPPPATDATLRALSLSQGALSPTFSSAQETYAAAVAETVSRVTVEATPTAAALADFAGKVITVGATVEYLDGNDMALTDADTATEGFQVDLARGANVIKTKVTAPDGTTTKNYPMTVTRTTQACNPSDPLELWCGAMTVGTGSSYFGYSSADSRGSVMPSTFTYRGATIDVDALQYLSGGALNFAISKSSGTTPSDGLLGADNFVLELGLGASRKTIAIDNPGTMTTFDVSNHGLSWSNGDVVSAKLKRLRRFGDGPQLDVPPNTEGWLWVRWNARAGASEPSAYNVEWKPVSELGTWGHTFRRVARARGRELLLNHLESGTEYVFRICERLREEPLQTPGWTHKFSFDRGECSVYSRITMPARGTATNDIKVSIEFPDGGTTKRLSTSDTEFRYRFRVTGVRNTQPFRVRNGGVAAAQVLLRFRNETVMATSYAGGNWHRVLINHGQRDIVMRLHDLTYEGPGEGYSEHTMRVAGVTTIRNKGPLVLYQKRQGDADAVGGPQQFLSPVEGARELCIDFTDTQNNVAEPCSSTQAAVDPPSVDGTPTASGAGTDGQWSEGETVGVTVTFNEAVNVDTTNGTPSIGIGLGGTAARSATYASGTGTTELVFEYALVSGDGSHQLMAVTPNSLALNGGTIQSSTTGFDAVLAHEGALLSGNSGRNPDATVAFTGVPESHDGESAFTLGVRFRARPANLAVTDATSVFETTGGSITAARLADKGERPKWELTVTPNGNGAVTVRLPARDCGEAHAVCINGQALSEAIETTVQGPTISAQFTQAPAEHDGSNKFLMQFEFSAEPTRYSYRTVRDALFTVQGGHIEKSRRLVPRRSVGWEITVVPDGDDAVTLTSIPTTDCEADHAACDADGRMFDGGLSLMVPGPATPRTTLPVVSVSAPSPVTEGTAAVFTLSRTRSADAALTVAVSVSESANVLDGTPATSVTFAVGSSSATLSVATEDDDIVEDASTVTVALGAGTGYRVSANAATAEVVVESEDLEPITAQWTQVPEEHDGSTPFLLHFEFSHNPAGLSYRTVHHRLFHVTGGIIVKARRLVRHRNVGWEIKVVPDGPAEVWLSARATTDCTAQYATCDADGRKFDGELRTTVLGPAPLSVADATVTEEEGATLDFVVTLGRSRNAQITVDYATSDGTARAGDDYTAASGTLTFEANETSKTVEVTVHDDAHDEGAETMTLTLSNASGAYIADATATGTIENHDHMPKAWMTRFGRTVGNHVVEALAQRLEGGGGSQVTVAGIGLLGAPGAEPEAEESDPFGLPDWAKKGALEEESQKITADDLLLRSAFHLSSGGEDTGAGPAFTAWGRVTTGGFEAEEDGDIMDGDVTTGLIGFDAEWERALAGVMLSQSTGEGSYRLDPEKGDDSGTVESDLTGVYPYTRLELNQRVSAWALAGAGTGTLTLHRTGKRAMPTDITMRMGAIGVKGQVLDGTGASGVGLNVKTDAMWVGMKSADTDELAPTQGDVTRLRLTLAGERVFAGASGRTFTPSVEVGIRHDGGDAETGIGLELGAGVRYVAGGLTVEGRGRTLLAHESSGYEEWGLSGAVRVNPNATGRGLTLSITPEWGRTGSASEQLWSAHDARGLSPEGEFEAQRRIVAEAGYGFGLTGNRGVLTPYAGMTLAEGSQRSVRTGARWQASEALAVGLEAQHSGAQDTTRDITLRVALRF